MTVEQYIALGASIGACLSAIAALLTIRVLVRQQRAAYRPALAFSRTMIRSTRCSHLPVPRMWTEESGDRMAAITAHNESRRTGNAEELYSNRRLFMKLRNIGLGSAHDICARWTFPMKKAVEQVNEIAQGASALSFGHGRVCVSSDDTLLSMGWRPEQHESIDYITTLPRKGEPFSLGIPHTYGVVVSAMYFYNQQSSTRRPLRIPVLRLDLSYKDIGQHKYKTSYDIHFNPAAGDGSSGEIIYGFLEHQRRKRSLLFDWSHRFIHGHFILPSYHSARISDTSASSFQSTET